MNLLFISFKQFVSRRKLIVPVALGLILTGVVETAPIPVRKDSYPINDPFDFSIKQNTPSWLQSGNFNASGSGFAGDGTRYVENEILIKYIRKASLQHPGLREPVQ